MIIVEDFSKVKKRTVFDLVTGNVVRDAFGSKKSSNPVAVKRLFFNEILDNFYSENWDQLHTRFFNASITSFSPMFYLVFKKNIQFNVFFTVIMFIATVNLLFIQYLRFLKNDSQIDLKIDSIKRIGER